MKARSFLDQCDKWWKAQCTAESSRGFAIAGWLAVGADCGQGGRVMRCVGGGTGRGLSGGREGGFGNRCACLILSPISCKKQNKTCSLEGVELVQSWTLISNGWQEFPPFHWLLIPPATATTSCSVCHGSTSVTVSVAADWM